MLNFKKCHEGKLYESYWKGVTQCAIFKFKLWVSLWTFPVVGGCNIYFNEILACSAAQSTEGSIVLERDGGTGSATQRHALRVFPPSETCSAVTSMPSLTRANSTSGRQSSTKVTWIQPMRLLVYFCLTCSFFFFSSQSTPVNCTVVQRMNTFQKKCEMLSLMAHRAMMETKAETCASMASVRYLTAPHCSLLLVLHRCKITFSAFSLQMTVEHLTFCMMMSMLMEKRWGWGTAIVLDKWMNKLLST